MPSYSGNVWKQLKNLTSKKLCKALTKDGWRKHLEGGKTKGSVQVYVKNIEGKTRRVTVHYHNVKGYGPQLLKVILERIGWTEQDLRRLKLIK